MIVLFLPSSGRNTSSTRNSRPSPLTPTSTRPVSAPMKFTVQLVVNDRGNQDEDEDDEDPEDDEDDGHMRSARNLRRSDTSCPVEVDVLKR